jgi:hypothetical protein
VHHVFDVGFDFVAVLAEAHGAGHARAALHGVQEAQQALGMRGVGRRVLPGAQCLADLRQQVGAFFEEHRQQVGIQFIVEDGGSGGQDFRLGRRQRDHLGFRFGSGRRFASTGARWLARWHGGCGAERLGDFQRRVGEGVVEGGVEQIVDAVVNMHFRFFFGGAVGASDSGTVPLMAL